MPKQQGPEESDAGTTTLSIQQYPELKGIQPGDKLSGTFEGSVDSVDGDNVTVSYSSMDLQTENPADKTFKKMTGQGQPSSPSQDDSEDY